MAPKKVKDPTSDDNYWRSYIEEAPLDEDHWKVKVIIIEAAGTDQDRTYLNKFEIHAAEEKRFVIKNICKTETTFMINQLGSEKKVKDDNLRVFEEAQTYLKEKKDIPPDVMALVIKHLILKIKEEYIFIRRQRLEVREGIRRESATMVDRAEVRGSINVKTSEPIETLEPPPKGKGKKDEQEKSLQTPDFTEGKKYNTLLRVRGEEWRDKVYVDDYPVDGPNLYVAITGFVEPYLPGCLVKIGIPLTAIVQVRIDSSSTRVPSSLLKSSKRGQSQTEILMEKSMKFWDDLQRLRIHTHSTDIYKNTAFIVFSPPYWDSEQLSGNPDQIYNELCSLMYDIQDLTRQHNHYLSNIDIIHIPEDIGDDRSFKFYHQQIKDLPLESVTIFSLLDNVLNAVDHILNSPEKSSRTSLSTAVTLNKPISITAEENDKVLRAQKLINDVFSTLCKTEANKKTYRLSYGKEYEEHRDPVIIQHGHLAKYSTFHLGNINLDNIIWRSLIGMPLNNLWLNQNQVIGEIEAKVNFHVNVLLSCFERKDVETAELYRLMHILACRKLYNNRSSLRKKHLLSSTISEFKKVYLKRSVLAEPLPQCPGLLRGSSATLSSYPSISQSDNDCTNSSKEEDEAINRIKFLFDCPDISELVSSTEIVTEQTTNHMIDEFEFFEDFNGVSAFQVLLEAFTVFNCVDYKYCEVTDNFLLMFFNSQDDDGISREEWRCHITTPLCLQDFFDFVLEENYDWIQNEEKIYEGVNVSKSQSVCKVVADVLAEKSCVDNLDVELELLMEGSLKYQEIIQKEEASPETTRTNNTPKKNTASPISTEADSKSTRKPKSISSKKFTPSFTDLKSGSELSVNIPKKPFTGYDLGDRRVEVFGQNSTFFSKDGTRVISKYTLTIPLNLEYIVLNVVPGNGVNNFWLYRALGEYVPSEVIDMCESFRISSKDQVIIYVKKQNYKVAIPLMSTSFTDDRKSKIPLTKMSIDKFAVENQIYENKYFHSLSITWPNGLITETVHEENLPDISHIKQFYLNPLVHLDEEMRCVSLKGEVVIFRPSGIIEVLRPEGSVIKIKKCEKKVVQQELLEELRSDVSSDKSKKPKDKTKEKEKSSKVSSKSSKNVVNDNSSEIKPLEYELFIEEYETIDTNGLRQNWVNEIPQPIEKLIIRTATDFCLHEIFTRRMDGTNILLNKDGVQIVTFPNKTRIITKCFIEADEIYPEWTEEELEYFYTLESLEREDVKSKTSITQKSFDESTLSSNTSGYFKEEQMREKIRTDGFISVQIIISIEHENFTTVTIDRTTNKISVESPNKTKIDISHKDMSILYDIQLDHATTAKFDGDTLHVNYEACYECGSKTTSSIKVKTDEISSVTKIHQNWLKMKDSFCKKIVVNEEGHITVLGEPCSTDIYQADDMVIPEDNDTNEDKHYDNKSESVISTHGKCRDVYMAKTLRFFVLRRDLACSELVHRTLLDEYKRNCRWQPWCSISQYDTFGDHRSLVSILTPIHLTESEKWLMESKLAGKPKHLAFKDLKEDSGKGFYHWMRPYERFMPEPIKPDNVLPPRLPRAFILRTLEQQWDEKRRPNLKGARELISAILRYRHVMESDSETIMHIPIKDMRLENERRTDDVIQAIAHRVYEDLKTRLAEDVECRAKATITTKPLPISSEMSVEGEFEGEYDEIKDLEEERSNLLKEVESAEAMSPYLERYWRRRAEEFKEEEFYKYLLREGSVPPYFRNVLGGAIWWEMNNTAGQAATLAERRKMKCVCAEETSRSDDPPVPFM